MYVVTVSYTHLIRPVVTYACETWLLTQKDEQYLGIFEQKILRKMFKPMQNNNGSWRILRDQEINNLIHGAMFMNIGIAMFIKSRKIAWLGHR